MRSYTLHLPRGTLSGEVQGLERAQLVPDAFSWAAFAFGPLWFLYHRLWLAACGVATLLAATAGMGRLLGLDPLAGLAVTLLVLTLVALEASSLRRWTYASRGRPVRDAVVAGSAAEAEAKAIGRWIGPAPAAAPAVPHAGGSGRPVDVIPAGVIGLFPESEGRR